MDKKFFSSKLLLLIFFCLGIPMQANAQRLPVNTISQMREGFIPGFHEALKEYTGEGISIYYVTKEKADLNFLKTIDKPSIKNIQTIIDKGPKYVNFLFNSLFSPDAVIKFLTFDDLEKGEDKKILHAVIVIEDIEHFIEEATRFKEQLLQLAQKNVVIVPYTQALVTVLTSLDLVDKVLITAPFDAEKFSPVVQSDVLNIDIDIFTPTISSSLIFLKDMDEEEKTEKIQKYQRSTIHAALLASGASLVLEKVKKDKVINPIRDTKALLWKHTKKMWFPPEDHIVYFDMNKHQYQSNEAVKNVIPLLDSAAALDLPMEDHYLKAMQIDKAHSSASGKDVKVAIIDHSFIKESSSMMPSIILHEIMGKEKPAQLPGPGFLLSQELIKIAPGVQIIALESSSSSDELRKAIERAIELMANIVVIRDLPKNIAKDLVPTLQKLHDKGVLLVTPSYCGPQKDFTVFEIFNSGSSFVQDKVCGEKNEIKVTVDTLVLPADGIRQDFPYVRATENMNRLSSTAIIAGVTAMMLEMKNDIKNSEVKKVLSSAQQEFGFGNTLLDAQKVLEEVDQLKKKNDLESYSDKMKKNIENLIAVKDQKSLREQLKESFSFTYMSKLALGNHWDTLTEKEKEDFLSLLRENILQGLVKVILQKERSINVKGSVIKGDMATVKAYVKQKEVDIEFQFQFVKLEGKWLLYNVIVDNASLLDRYKQDFQEYMKKNSFEALLDKMRKNLENVSNSVNPK